MDAQRNNKIRVLVMDDSALMSRQIAGILNDDGGIEVVGRAKDGQEAIEMVLALKPDVVTLDVEMPRMNGITALKHIMVRHATPTVMISALTTDGARTTFDALKYGAIDVIAKPSRREDESLDAQKADIIAKVRRAASIRTGRSRYIRMGQPDSPRTKISLGPADENTRFVGIGTGTGGYYALLRIVPGLKADFQHVLVVVLLVARRYLPPFVAYLDEHSDIPVKSVQGVNTPEKGACYVCSWQDGLAIERDAQGVRFKTDAAQDESHGSIDRMLISMTNLGPRAVGVILTGAGKDGAEGMAVLRRSGGRTIVQDINNCLDPNMPLAVLEKDGAEMILADYQIAEFLTTLSSPDQPAMIVNP